MNLHVGDGMSIQSLFLLICFFISYQLISLWAITITGVAFIENAPEGTYDAVIVDSSDPIGNIIHTKTSCKL